MAKSKITLKKRLLLLPLTLLLILPFSQYVSAASQSQYFSEVREVYVGDYIDDATVCFLGKALVLTAVARLHMENRDMKPFCRYRGEAGVGVSENEQGVGLYLRHKLIGAIDNIAYRRAKVVTHRVHIYLGVCKLQILEKHAVEVIIVILSRMSENAVEIAAALVNHRGKTDYLGACAHYDKQLKLSVVLKFYVTKVKLYVHYSTTS